MVADCPATGCVNSSPVALVMNLLSLLNHDSLTDDDAMVETRPFVPVNANPCDSDGR